MSSYLWNTQYSRGEWDYLEELAEQHRYVIISSYISSKHPKSSVLDIGSGTGILLKFINPARYAYTGIDISPIALKHIRYQQPNVTTICSKIEDFSPTPERKFDVIVFNEVLYYLKKPSDQIDKYRQFLSPNGLLIISMWRPPFHDVVRRKFFQSIWDEINLRFNQKTKLLNESDHVYIGN